MNMQQNDFMTNVMALMSNPNDARKQIDNFANNLQGDPQRQVEQLLNSGQMSQGQYNMLSGIAKNLMKVL